jgi:hypothetical protein
MKNRALKGEAFPSKVIKTFAAKSGNASVVFASEIIPQDWKPKLLVCDPAYGVSPTAVHSAQVIVELGRFDFAKLEEGDQIANLRRFDPVFSEWLKPLTLDRSNHSVWLTRNTACWWFDYETEATEGALKVWIVRSTSQACQLIAEVVEAPKNKP